LFFYNFIELITISFKNIYKYNEFVQKEQRISVEQSSNFQSEFVNNIIVYYLY